MKFQHLSVRSPSSPKHNAFENYHARAPRGLQQEMVKNICRGVVHLSKHYLRNKTPLGQCNVSKKCLTGWVVELRLVGESYGEG